jgi:L-fuconolactonase
MSKPAPGSREWLDLVREPIIDPGRPIVDPHHHLWRRPGNDYLLEDLWLDTESGHRIERTVFVECGACYREHGPEHLRCVGETEFVREQAEASAGAGKARIAAIVARADLTLAERVEEVLAAHVEAAGGLFRASATPAPGIPIPRPSAFRVEHRRGCTAGRISAAA